MALSEQEQRMLDEMERNLYQSETDVVETASLGKRRPTRRSIVLGVLILILGVACLIFGVASQVIILGVLGFVIMFAGAIVVLTPGKGGMSPKPGSKSSTRQSSFEEKMTERWRRRRSGD